MRAFINRSPFLCLGTANAAGKADVSPRGDPPGFVQILDDETLLIPDRPGNNHLDSIENIIANPNVGLIFFVPGSEETLRVNGRARVVDDPSLLASDGSTQGSTYQARRGAAADNRCAGRLPTPAKYQPR
jgi:predicted pyridoxine 5'-phosphate oxidase superfamily flavin-nucleotide-binding protein